MILVTGAAGKTGEHVVAALTARAQRVRALARLPEQAARLKTLGADEAFSGDMRDPQALHSACLGVEALYHIAPNMCQDELTIGEALIGAAKAAGVRHFVYHSVLHPQVEEMPHHWLKLRVEEALFKSGLEYTILQPAAYMQNLLGYRAAMVERGVYAVPYSLDSRQSMVNLNDVAEAAALVLTQTGHAGAIYELVSRDAPSAREIASAVSERIGRAVRPEQLDRAAWEAQARTGGMNDYAVTTLLKMFAYYERYNFCGNSHVLGWLLGREPGRLADFLDLYFMTQ